MAKYILILDVGTTNIKGIIFDRKGEITHQTLVKPKYIMDEPGQMEQDPNEIWEACRKVLHDVLVEANLTAKDIDSMGISTQRASFMFWDKSTGEIHSNIITWQDKRVAKFAEKTTKSAYFRILRGLSSILYTFSRNNRFLAASQMQFNSDYASIRTKYHLLNHPQLQAKIEEKSSNIVWGTIDTWILWNLTEGEVHATDYSNASSTGMYDPFTLQWNTIVLNKFKIPLHILPEIKDTNANFGITKLFGNGPIHIHSIIADQQASMFGQCCFQPGEMKVTNGTGSFVDLNTGLEAHASKRKLYPLIAWRIDGEVIYKLEGMSHNTGIILDWIKEELKLFDNYSDLDEMVKSVDSTGGVFFLPTFSSGISYPYWDPTARGNIFGINLKTKKEHLLRAVLNGIAFRIKDFVQGIIDDTGVPISKIKADGGVSRNTYFLQFLADILGIEVEHSENPEPTALGAAFVAGLSMQFWQSKEEVASLFKIDEIYKPKIDEKERNHLYSCWKDIVKRSLNYHNQ